MLYVEIFSYQMASFHTLQNCFYVFIFRVIFYILQFNPWMFLKTILQYALHGHKCISTRGFRIYRLFLFFLSRNVSLQNAVFFFCMHFSFIQRF